MRRIGRQTKLTPAIQKSICQVVMAGVGVVEAAALAGIARATVLQWVQRGEGRSDRRPTPAYVAFVEALTRAKASDEARRVARIEAAGRGGAVIARKTMQYPDGRTVTEETYTQPDWRADAFHLERHYPDKWGRFDRVRLQVQIEAVAARVAGELGLTVEEVLGEAQLLLQEMDRNEV